MLIRLAVAHHLAQNSYPITLLRQLGLSEMPVPSIKDAFDQGYRLFWWDKLTADQLPIFPEPILLITDNQGLGYNRSDHLGNSFSITHKESKVKKCRFFARLPVYPGGGNLGSCCDGHNQELKNSGMTLEAYAGGFLLSFPWSLNTLRLGDSWNYRDHSIRGGDGHFLEAGPLMDFPSFRRLFFQLLHHIVTDKLSLPLLHRAWKANSGPTYSFRLDGDNFCPRATETAMDVIGKRRFSWFLRLDSWRDSHFIKYLENRDQDVQVHCFQHMTYRCKKLNTWNLTLAKYLLKRAGVRPTAAVSPFGFYFPGWAEALRDWDCEYSSEFGYSIDDLPSYPENNPAMPVQLPVHPGCVGVLSHLGDDEMLEHFKHVALQSVDAQGHVVLYDHPTTGLAARPDVFRSLFQWLGEQGITFLPLPKLAALWKERYGQPHEAMWDGKQILLEYNPPSQFPLKLWTSKKMRSLSAEGVFSESDITHLEIDDFRYRAESEHHIKRRRVLERTKLTPLRFLGLLAWRELNYRLSLLLPKAGRKPR